METNIQTLAAKIALLAKESVIYDLPVRGGCVFSASMTHEPLPTLYEPMICLIAQGAKNCHVGSETFSYAAGDLFINFLPLPVETEIT